MLRAITLTWTNSPANMVNSTKLANLIMVCENRQSRVKTRQSPDTLHFVVIWCRTECLSFLDRLDLEKIHHHSFYARNILVQPGPLDVGPPLRSMKTPSYRLIDLGRTQHWDVLAKLEQERRNLPDERDDTQDHKTKMEWRNIKHQWDLDNEASRKLGRVELLLPPL